MGTLSQVEAQWGEIGYDRVALEIYIEIYLILK